MVGLREDPSRRLGFDLFRVRRASQFPQYGYRSQGGLSARPYVFMYCFEDDGDVFVNREWLFRLIGVHSEHSCRSR